MRAGADNGVRMQNPSAMPPDDEHGRPLVFDIGDAKSMYFDFDGVQSSMKRGQPSVLDVDYTKTMMGFMLAKAQPEQILMIGLGGGSLPKFCFHNLAARITVVEINPHVIALRDEFEVPADSERFCVVQADGADFVHNHPPCFDVILIDGFTQQGQSPQLCSTGFYQDCFNALTPGGLLVVNNLHSTPAFDQICQSVAEVFEAGVACVDSREYGNCIMFASKRGSVSTRSMSLSWALHNLQATAREQLATEFRRILRTLETTEGQRRLDEVDP
ncbi:transferase [Caenimonas koreensis DSM 17982]|uniref:Transferase n=1 Tax=Caenimonas koreensis DSM 17982 TaxID=1121255 RepID=A0A844BDB5_9BURK|nr:fused MFS/spermidine synthase [Caenimonas koreensis]MRD48491.1 transferase [Caenimonas koreensis DSM 17982]